MNYRKATHPDIPEIKELWKVAFGDADDYISRFIEHFGIENGYVCEINRRIVSIAFALPTNLKSPSNFEGVPEGRGSLCQGFKGSRVQEFKYLYACATHPDFQSQGIMKNLLETIYDEACRENFAGVFLQAIHQSLAEYYQKLGFEAFFFRGHAFYYNHREPENPLRPLRLKTISPENYCKKRTEKLENHCFVDWDEDFFRFLNETGTHYCEYENTIFSFKTHINTIIVDEWLGDTPSKKIADLLFEELPDFEVVHIRSIGNEFCCGQIKWCHQSKNFQKKGWLGFAME